MYAHILPRLITKSHQIQGKNIIPILLSKISISQTMFLVLKPLLGGEFYVLEQFKISLRLILCYYRKTLKNCYQSQLFKLTLHLYQAPESILLSGLMLVTQRLRHLIFNPR